MADQSKKKPLRKSDDEYLGCNASFEKTVELKTEDIATNSKKTMTILKNYIDSLTQNNSDDDNYDENNFLESVDLTGTNLHVYVDDEIFYSFVFSTINHSFIKIAPLHNKQGKMYLPSGQITVTFVKDGKRYGFDASVIEYKDNLIRIKRETRFFTEDMRKNQRVAVDIPAKLIFDDFAVDCKIVDLDKGGARIVLLQDQSLLIDQVATLDFIFNEVHFALYGKIIRVFFQNQNKSYVIQFFVAMGE